MRVRIAAMLPMLGLALAAAAPAAAAPEEPPHQRFGRIERVEHPPSDMVVVPAGKFVMGHDDDEWKEFRRSCKRELGASDYVCDNDWFGIEALKQRTVDLDVFAIDRYEVTVADYRACVTAGGCDIAALIEGDERHLSDELPMVNATWQDAVDFCAWQGKRLPTEAEWEKAARGEDGNRWPWGNHVRSDGSNHGAVESEAVLYTHGVLPRQPNSRATFEFTPDAGDGYAYAAPPGALRWGQSPYGVYDMAGNVAEWVADYYSFEGYGDLDLSNPVRDVHNGRVLFRVVRGGSWNQPTFYGRAYHREPGDANTRLSWRGFRCARNLDEQ